MIEYILPVVAFFGGLYLIWRRPSDDHAWQIGIPALSGAWFAHKMGWGFPVGVIVGVVAALVAVYLGDRRIEKEKEAKRQRARLNAALKKQTEAKAKAQREAGEIIGETVSAVSPAGKKNEDMVDAYGPRS